MPAPDELHEQNQAEYEPNRVKKGSDRARWFFGKLNIKSARLKRLEEDRDDDEDVMAAGPVLGYAVLVYFGVLIALYAETGEWATLHDWPQALSLIALGYGIWVERRYIRD